MQGSRSVCRAANHHHDRRYLHRLKKSPSPPSVSTPGPPPQPRSAPPGSGSCAQLFAKSWLACLQVLGSGPPTAWALVGLLRWAALPGARASGPSSAGPPVSAPGQGGGQWWAGGGRPGCSRSPAPTTPGTGIPLLPRQRLLRPPPPTPPLHPGGGRGALRRRGRGAGGVLVTLAGAPLRHLVGRQLLSVILSSNKGSFMLK